MNKKIMQKQQLAEKYCKKLELIITKWLTLDFNICLCTRCFKQMLLDDDQGGRINIHVIGLFGEICTSRFRK